jgi:hypothetical protein
MVAFSQKVRFPRSAVTRTSASAKTPGNSSAAILIVDIGTPRIAGAQHRFAGDPEFTDEIARDVAPAFAHHLGQQLGLFASRQPRGTDRGGR